MSINSIMAQGLKYSPPVDFAPSGSNVSQKIQNTPPPPENATPALDGAACPGAKCLAQA